MAWAEGDERDQRQPNPGWISCPEANFVQRFFSPDLWYRRVGRSVDNKRVRNHSDPWKKTSKTYANNTTVYAKKGKAFAVGPVLVPFLEPKKGPSLEHLLGLPLPSKARHAQSEATGFVDANCI